ncbi:MAG: NTP transferase domain-containing protein, partial [Firmicutes bacterium]|nr:NTP transferase domain-containing protein [Bacillota bacterium]
MKAIILAAGQGKRMRSKLQKLLHPILGKTIIQYVVEAAFSAGIEDVTVVVGRDGEEIAAELIGIYPQLHFAIQDKPLGTGHAVQAGIGRINDDDDVIIFKGDMPLVTAEFIGRLKAFYLETNAEAIVTAAYYPPLGDLGRVFSDANGFFQEIIECKDVKPDTPATEWINTGNYIFKGSALKQGLAKMDNKNSQNEYYLTDVPKILRENGRNVRVLKSMADMAVFTGINTQVQLAEAVSHMRNRINAMHMLNGVRMIDPATVYIDDTVEIEAEAVIYPGVILEGNCKISEGAVIGANSHLKNTIVGANAHIRQSVLCDSVVGAG